MKLKVIRRQKGLGEIFHITGRVLFQVADFSKLEHKIASSPFQFVRLHL